MTPRLLHGLLLIGAIANTESALARTQARLVGCGDATCLRISGHRDDVAIAIRLAGRDLAVAGGKAWHATLPLADARESANAARDALSLTSSDARTGSERTELVAVPPGSLGRRIDLASLVVSAH